MPFKKRERGIDHFELKYKRNIDYVIRKLMNLPVDTYPHPIVVVDVVGTPPWGNPTFRYEIEELGVLKARLKTTDMRNVCRRFGNLRVKHGHRGLHWVDLENLIIHEKDIDKYMQDKCDKGLY